MSEEQAPLRLIAEGAEYALSASDDGSTFVLRFKTDRLAARLEGEDAVRFRTDYERSDCSFRLGSRTSCSLSSGTRADIAGLLGRKGDEHGDDNAREDD